MQTSKFPSVNQPPKPPVQPTMTNASLIPPMPEPMPLNGVYPAELADDITAMPLTSPMFCDIPLKSYDRVGRWIFKDVRRYTQALAQGWVVTKAQDVKSGHASPYVAEGGTKYINGDLIHMHIDRKRYLGALRYKHQVSAALADSSAQKRIGAQKAQRDMGDVVNAINRQRAAQGMGPAMEAFVPGAEDLPEGRLPGVMGNDDIANKELGRLGGTPDMGHGADINLKPL